MRRVTVEQLCDLHQDIQAAGEVVITINGKARMLDLCAADYETMVSMFSQGVDPAKVSAMPPTRRMKQSDNDCPVCEAKPVSRSALGAHLKLAHDTGIRALTAQGLLDPVPTGRAAWKAS